MSVDYATANGGAVAPADYVAVDGMLRFAPGRTAKRVLVSNADDAIHEPRETFGVELASAAAATIGDGSAQTTILDNDP